MAADLFELQLKCVLDFAYQNHLRIDRQQLDIIRLIKAVIFSLKVKTKNEIEKPESESNISSNIDFESPPLPSNQAGYSSGVSTRSIDRSFCDTDSPEDRADVLTPINSACTIESSISSRTSSINSNNSSSRSDGISIMLKESSLHRRDSESIENRTTKHMDKRVFKKFKQRSREIEMSHATLQDFSAQKNPTFDDYRHVLYAIRLLARDSLLKHEYDQLAAFLVKGREIFKSIRNPEWIRHEYISINFFQICSYSSFDEAFSALSLFKDDSESIGLLLNALRYEYTRTDRLADVDDRVAQCFRDINRIVDFIEKKNIILSRRQFLKLTQVPDLHKAFIVQLDSRMMSIRRRKS